VTACIPVVGDMLTTTTLVKAAVPAVKAGIFSSGVPAIPAVYCTVFNPVACAVLGCVSVGLGLGALYSAKKVYVKKSEVYVKKSARRIAAEIRELAEDMVMARKQDKEFWRGLTMAVEGALKAIEKLDGTKPGRVATFDRRMLESGKKMHVLREALDECIVWLSMSNYYPPNYSARTLIGGEQYDFWKKSLMQDSLSEKKNLRSRPSLTKC